MAYDEHLAARIRDLVYDEPGLSEVRMFGGLAFLIDGHMTIAASRQGGLLVRVDPERADELVADSLVKVMVMAGRERPGWLRVEAEHIASDDNLATWVTRAKAYVRTLPPKNGRGAPSS